MPGMPYPTGVDECCDRLRRFGWRAVAGPDGPERWLVDSTNGENALRAEAATLAEALRLACGQARAVGMPAPAAGRGEGPTVKAVNWRTLAAVLALAAL
jgi:hypothetical protein